MFVYIDYLILLNNHIDIIFSFMLLIDPS